MMGLGAYPETTLAEAREKARLARKLLADGIDPIDHRDAELAKTQVAGISFKEAADAYFEHFHRAWSDGNQRVFRNILANHILPVIGDLPVRSVDTEAVLRVLRRNDFWDKKTPTAVRCQQAMRAIFDFAVTRGWRPRESFNPATWNGHLENSLPSPARVHLTENHPSLPWQRLGEFMQQLREIGSWPIHGNDLHSISAAVLEFQILTIDGRRRARLPSGAISSWTIGCGRSRRRE
jgi:hypothetical protein